MSKIRKGQYKYKTSILSKLKIKLFSKPYKLNFKNIAKDFQEEKETYNKLKLTFKDKKLKNKDLIIYNPGGGYDVLTILLLLDTIAKTKTNLTIIFQEIRDQFPGIVKQLKDYTSSSIIIRHKSNTKYVLSANYKNKRINIIYYLAPIESFLPVEVKRGYDIYYERAFQFFRSNNAEYFYNIQKYLRPQGFLISDYGFDFNKRTAKNFKKLKSIPKQYGLYNNFQIWQKISN